MKKLTFILIALAISAWTGTAAAGAQTWTVYGDKDLDYEFTILTREEFERIRKAAEISAVSVMIDYTEEKQVNFNGKVIKGKAPELQGYVYFLQKFVNLSQVGREIDSMVVCSLRYWYVGRGWVHMIFFNVDTSDRRRDCISLYYNRAEYERRYSEFCKLVEGR